METVVEEADYDCFTQPALKLFVGNMRSRALKMHKYEGVSNCFDKSVSQLQPYRTYPSDNTVCYLKNDFINLLLKCCKETGNMNDFDHGPTEGQPQQPQQELQTKSGPPTTTTDTTTTTTEIPHTAPDTTSSAPTTADSSFSFPTDTGIPATPEKKSKSSSEEEEEEEDED